MKLDDFLKNMNINEEFKTSVKYDGSYYEIFKRTVNTTFTASELATLKNMKYLRFYLDYTNGDLMMWDANLPHYNASAVLGLDYNETNYEKIKPAIWGTVIVDKGVFEYDESFILRDQVRSLNSIKVIRFLKKFDGKKFATTDTIKGLQREIDVALSKAKKKAEEAGIKW